MTPALLETGAATGTTIRWPPAKDGEAEQWIGTASSQAVPASAPGGGNLRSDPFAWYQTAPPTAPPPRPADYAPVYSSAWPRHQSDDRATAVPVVEPRRPDPSGPGSRQIPTTPLTTGQRLTMESATTVLWQRSFLAEALVALKHVALDRGNNEATWMDAAQRLRTAAVAGRSRAPRHAALALIFSDALTFTLPEDVGDQGWGGLVRGLVCLQEPFISSDDERVVIRSLLEGGWSITGPFDVDAFSQVAPELFD